MSKRLCYNVGMNAKTFFVKATNPKILFYVMIGFIISSLLVGLMIDFFISDSSERHIVAIVVGIIIAILAKYLLVGYIYNIVVGLKSKYKEKDNLFKLYYHDKLFRMSVNKSLSCFYVLANAFINFIYSFTSFKWFYLSISAIFFVVFIMQLYLITNLGDDRLKQNKVIAALIIFMGIATSGIAVLLNTNETTYSSKGMMIYWDALYVFVSFISAIVSIVHAIKRKDNVMGRFLSVKLANAVFGMFTLTVTIPMTFQGEIDSIKLLAIIVGAVCSILIIGIGISNLIINFKQKKKVTEKTE